MHAHVCTHSGPHTQAARPPRSAHHPDTLHTRRSLPPPPESSTLTPGSLRAAGRAAARLPEAPTRGRCAPLPAGRPQRTTPCRGVPPAPRTASRVSPALTVGPAAAAAAAAARAPARPRRCRLGRGGGGGGGGDRGGAGGRRGWDPPPAARSPPPSKLNPSSAAPPSVPRPCRQRGAPQPLTCGGPAPQFRPVSAGERQRSPRRVAAESGLESQTGVLLLPPWPSNVASGTAPARTSAGSPLRTGATLISQHLPGPLRIRRALNSPPLGTAWPMGSALLREAAPRDKGVGDPLKQSGIG